MSGHMGHTRHIMNPMIYTGPRGRTNSPEINLLLDNTDAMYDYAQACNGFSGYNGSFGALGTTQQAVMNAFSQYQAGMRYAPGYGQAHGGSHHGNSPFGHTVREVGGCAALGAAIGAGVGMLIPIPAIGPGIGAAVGGVLGALYGYLKDSH